MIRVIIVVCTVVYMSYYWAFKVHTILKVSVKRKFMLIFYVFNVFSIAVLSLIFHPLPNCTPPAIEQFPKPFIGQEMRQKGAVLFHIAVALYMFIGIAIVSDDYFVPACEHMAECTLTSNFLVLEKF